MPQNLSALHRIKVRTLVQMAQILFEIEGKIVRNIVVHTFLHEFLKGFPA